MGKVIDFKVGILLSLVRDSTEGGSDNTEENPGRACRCRLVRRKSVSAVQTAGLGRLKPLRERNHVLRINVDQVYSLQSNPPPFAHG
jgi:hypothetical protein